METSEIINRITEELLKIEPEMQIYLYGSRSRGDFRTDSDWDVLVISPKEDITFEYEMKLREPIVDLELEFGEVISLLVYSKNDWVHNKHTSPLFHNVLNDGFLLSK